MYFDVKCDIDDFDKYFSVVGAIKYLRSKTHKPICEIAQYILDNNYVFKLKSYKKESLVGNNYDIFEMIEDRVKVDKLSAVEYLLKNIDDYPINKKLEYFPYPSGISYWVKDDFLKSVETINFLNSSSTDKEEQIHYYNQIKKINQSLPTVEQIDTIEPYQNKIESLIKENQQLQIEVENLKTSHCSAYNHKFFLYKQPLYTINECACIASGYDPLDIQKLPVENIDEILPEYSMAYNFINSAIEAEVLNCFNYKVSAGDLKEYLAKQEIEIKKFNEVEYAQFQISIKEQNKFNDINIAIVESEEIKLLKNKIDELKAALESKDDDLTALAIDLTVTESTYGRLKDELNSKNNENEKLKTDLLEKDERIKEFESIQTNQDESKLGTREETKKDYLDLTPELEIPNARQRNNVLRIISILSDMADLPPDEHFVAFNMMEAHANKKCKEIPKKDTVANWLKESKKF